MNLTVHTLGQSLEPLCLRQIGEFINPSIDRCRRAIYHPTFISEDTSLHVIQIVLA